MASALRVAHRLKLSTSFNQEINVGLANPTINERIADLGGEAFVSSPADLAKFVVEKTEAWAKVVRAANIRAE